MRATLLASMALIAVASPVTLAAQEIAPEPQMAELADRLSDPAQQDRMADMIGAMGEVLLAMPVGPMMEAMAKATGEQSPDLDRNATLRDLAGPEADRMPAAISEKVPQMMGMMAGMVKGIDAMRPMLEQMGNVMRDEVRRGGRF